MSMWELFVNDEVVDRVNLQTDKYEEAHTYFRLRKNLDSESFNDLFIVTEYIPSKKTMGNVEWWNGETTKLDDFQEKIMKKIIRKVLDELGDTQINLGSEAAREIIAALISAALKEKGEYKKHTSDKREKK